MGMLMCLEATGTSKVGLHFQRTGTRTILCTQHLALYWWTLGAKEPQS